MEEETLHEAAKELQFVESSVGMNICWNYPLEFLLTIFFAGVNEMRPDGPSEAAVGVKSPEIGLYGEGQPEEGSTILDWLKASYQPPPVNSERGPKPGSKMTH